MNKNQARCCLDGLACMKDEGYSPTHWGQTSEEEYDALVQELVAIAELSDKERGILGVYDMVKDAGG